MRYSEADVKASSRAGVPVLMLLMSKMRGGGSRWKIALLNDILFRAFHNFGS